MEKQVFQVAFSYKNEAGESDCLVLQVPEGETPVPKDIPAVCTTDAEILTFRDWSLPLSPVTNEFFLANGDGIRLLYEARYASEARSYTVKFLRDGEPLYSELVEYGKLPEYKGEEIAVPAGYRFPCWLGLVPVKGDMELSLAFSVSDPVQLEWAYSMGNLSFGSSNDNSGNVIGVASADLFMTLEVRRAPDLTYAARYRDRVVASLRHFVSDEGSCPYFDLEPYWCYAPLTAAITLCKSTPAIWNCLTPNEVEKFDIIMRSFAYILGFGTTDANDYATGPAMLGNFGKDWNPNYRLANILPMIFVGQYFGGAEAVNRILHGFDFDATVAEFGKHKCFSRAYARWSTEIPRNEDGTLRINPDTNLPYPTPKEFMEKGGDAYIFKNDPRLGYTGNGEHAGTGKGVRTDYVYHGCTLDNVAGILDALLSFTFSGGTVFSDSKVLGERGIYPPTALSPELAGKSKAYILDGTVSPVEGMPGLMLEFNSGDGGNRVNGQNTSAFNGVNIRSSASYNIENFVMVSAAIAALDELGLYCCTDPKNLPVFRLMWVGFTDFLYKLKHGYMSYSLGRGYESHEGEGANEGFNVFRAWWTAGLGKQNPFDEKANA